MDEDAGLHRRRKAWWLVNTRSDKLRRGSRAEINRRALHNARPEGEKRDDEGKRAVVVVAGSSVVYVRFRARLRAHSISHPLSTWRAKKSNKRATAGKGGGEHCTRLVTAAFVASSLTVRKPPLLHETRFLDTDRYATEAAT